MFFNRGAAGKKLDYFLSFLQVCSPLSYLNCIILTSLQYYIYTKQPLPMDIEFIVQDTFSLTRPQWKLATTLEEATKAFNLALAQDQKNAGLDKTTDQDDTSSSASSNDDGGDGDGDGDGDIVLPEADGDDDSELGEDDDIEV